MGLTYATVKLTNLFSHQTVEVAALVAKMACLR
ncbi:hypothetical protein CCP4SC76_7180002 [Gammaproteobacteria bacterium]